MKEAEAEVETQADAVAVAEAEAKVEQSDEVPAATGAEPEVADAAGPAQPERELVQFVAD